MIAMRILALFAAVAVLALGGVVASAQITLLNSASSGAKFATTTGTAHAIDKTNFRLGAASCSRAAGAANASYLPTGIVLDPTTNGGCATANKGYTIQFWYRPVASTALEYIFGDSTWSGASGQFRCFRNGAAGAGQLFLRGPLDQKTTTGAPLTTALDPNGWVHLAVVVDTTANSLTWYVNGAINGTAGTANATGKGTNLTCMGYNGSSSAGSTGNYDDFRVYNWARTAADIAADYNKTATGTGPSGCPNVPDHGYYECEAAVNPHIATIALSGEPHAGFTRLFTAGDTIEWQASSPATGPFAGTGIINISLNGPGSPRQDAYQQPPMMVGGPYTTPLAPGLEVGHCISLPPRWAMVWPDGLMIWPLISACGGGGVPVAYSYGGGPGPVLKFTMPNLGLVDGDRIDIQWVTLDATYPTGVASTNRTTFEYVTPKVGYGAHVEARGSNVIQETGFWEIWNTGTVPIKEVCIDFTTNTTANTWVPTGSLNSGGTLAAGTSFRHLTDSVCDLTPTTNPRYTIDTLGLKLCFQFVCPPAPADGFQGPSNHFIFDCDTSVDQAGSGYVGATVTVTFCDNKVLSGKLAIDPKDPNGAQIDL